MRVFIFRFNSPMLINVARALQRRGVEIAYWGGSKHYFEAVQKSSEFAGTIFHDTDEAIRGLPAPGIDPFSFPPLDAQFITDMLPAESQILTMMNAVDYDRTPTIEKKRIYYEYLRYWRGVLTTLKPEAVLFGDIPHIAYQFIVLRLAQHLGIKTAMFRVLQVTGRMIFTVDHERYPELAEVIQKNAGQNFTLADVSPDIQEYYRQQTNPAADSSPFYMGKPYTNSLEKAYRWLPGLATVWKHVRSGTLLATAPAYVRSFQSERSVPNLEGQTFSGWELKRKQREWAKSRESFRAEYRSMESPVDWSKKYIYVALHNQPECSTSAMGGVFVDQHLMIDLLAAALPPEWLLYVKESPVQWIGPRAHLGRYPGFYREIVQRPNVRLIPTEVSTYDLINKSQAVATVTGTAGWEAILRGKPALVFGYIFYMYCAGVFRINDIASCRAALEKISNGYVPDAQKVMNYLAAIDKASMRGYPNKRFKGDLPMTDEENARNIAESFYTSLIK